MNLQEILSRDDEFRYQLLARLKQDCDYFLGNGQRHVKHLWALCVSDHIEYMKVIWSSFIEKPEWLSHEEILKYEQSMKGDL